MRKPIFVRELTDEERQKLTSGLRSSELFTVRRSQIILSSARGEKVPRIAEFLGCDDQTVRNAIVAFNMRGVAALEMGFWQPKTIRPIFSDEGLEKLKAILDIIGNKQKMPTGTTETRASAGGIPPAGYEGHKPLPSQR